MADKDMNTSRGQNGPWRVWCLVRDQWGHVAPVESIMGAGAEFVRDEDWDPEEVTRGAADVVLCVNDYPFEVTQCLDAARRAGVPSLVLQDGILEWRCQYENPLFGAGGGAPQHQPVMADRIACIGNQSARQLAAWGNADKIEITGMARMDFLREQAVTRIRRPATRLLVMTAKNPGFTPAQRDVTLRSLQDVKRHLDGMDGLEVFWRTSREIGAELGVENRMGEAVSADLAQLLDRVDAVITTPSTAMLECMLLGRPVAVLDYHNVPRFVGSAWSIGAPEHLPSVMEEILEPPVNKLAFQADCLADALRLDGSAAARVAALISRLGQAGREARLSGQPLHLGESLINGSGVVRYFALPPLPMLYPDHPVFQVTDAVALQLRLARAESEVRRLKRANERLRLASRLASVFRRTWSFASMRRARARA